MIQEIEDEIISELKSITGIYPVKPYPENPSNYRLNTAKGEILVRYVNSEHESIDVSEVWRQRIMNYELVIICRNLRKPKGSQGAYHTIASIGNHMSGVKLRQAHTLCRINSDAFLGESGGVWQWVIKLSFGVIVTRKDNSTDGVLLKSVSADE